MISKNKKNIVFILWGKAPQFFEQYIDKKNDHLILKWDAPTAENVAENKWFGNQHFLLTTNYLKKMYPHQSLIQWGLWEYDNTL
jgi:uracil DNA glycosylase